MKKVANCLRIVTMSTELDVLAGKAVSYGRFPEMYFSQHHKSADVPGAGGETELWRAGGRLAIPPVIHCQPR